jgi:hypothetical protein
MPLLRQRVVRLAFIAVALQAMFVFFFVFPGHDPKPNGLQVGAVGPPAAVEAFAGRLASQVDGLEVKRYGSQAYARDAILDREIYGAFVLGSRGPQALLTAEAASFTVAQTLRQVGGRFGVRQVEDVRPLDRDDPRGASLNLFVLPVTIASLVAAMIGAQLVPELDVRRRALLLVGVGAVAGLLDLLIVGVAIGAIPGPFLAQAGLAALAVIGLLLSASGIIRLVGEGGTFVVFGLFLMIGNPASGLASAPELVPTPWKEVGPLLPPGALGQAVRNVAYFDAAAIALPVAVLAGWAIAGLALTAAADRKGPEMPAPGT